MGKLDELLKHQGNMDASLGVGYARGITPPGMSLDHAQRLPSRLHGVSKSKHTVEILVDKIQADPDQPRAEFDADALARLAHSLKTQGQLQPIRVRWDEASSSYIIIMGERRWRAAVQAQLETLTCVVHEGTPEPAALLALQLVENALREDLRPIEQAKAYQRLMEANGWSGNRLARELGIDQSSVSRALALLILPESVQHQVDAGALPARTASEIAKLPDPVEQVALAEHVATSSMSRAEVRAAVQSRRELPALTRREIRFEGGARIVITFPADAPPDTALDLLHRALQQLHAEHRAARLAAAAAVA